MSRVSLSEERRRNEQATMATKYNPEPYMKLFTAYGGEGGKSSLKPRDVRKIAESLGHAMSRHEAKEAVKKHDYDKDKKLGFQASLELTPQDHQDHFHSIFVPGVCGPAPQRGGHRGGRDVRLLPDL